jgi:shikimate dehydrogenase
MRTIALIGDPVAHSVSPTMHRAAFAAAGLHLDYVGVRIPRGSLAEAWPALREAHAGLNVTRPLKEEILPLLDHVSAGARRAGSVNTVVFEDGRAIGHSTDGSGFVAALARAGVRPRRVVVLGAGGAARAVLAALTDADVSAWSRNPAAVRRLPGVRALTDGDLPGAVARADLLVNATPVGQAPDTEGCPLPATVALHGGLTVFDLVYRPRVTPLLELARRSGCSIVEGVEMLVEQGVRSFELWTGRPAPVDAMREAARAALDRTEVPA